MPMDRHSGGGPPPHLRGRPVSGLEAAHANEYFDPFLNASTLKSILGYHRSMCEFLHLKPNVFPHFYPKLRANLTSWRAKAVWKKFDARASHKCYGKGKACAGTRVLIIGAGPCGMRTAIEAQLLGAKVVVVEKRDRLSRNNVLHLWPFVIEDLRMLGAKKFFGKFCAGAIDHISIRQLQCIMLKVALLLGVEVHTEVSFEKLVEPNASEKTGWRAEVKPENHPVSQYEFDVIIGADGKRNTLQGFKRKEFRGKLAIAITANFINKKTEAEARVEEISGVAFIFNQKFFKDLQGETRIDLENIVYYKDDTHYFVMTAKKASLLEKGVIKHDLADTEKLLAPENVDRDALQNYAREAADFSTNYLMPDLEFAVNHYGQPDVAMFDFTSMYAAEYASKVVEKNGNRLLMILVGDSLLEPFWPTGSGCARGFLSSLDAAWAIRSWASGQVTPLDVLAERESIYRLLAQTTPDNLNKDWKGYTLDPVTRYPNLNKTVVLPHQTICLYETDNPQSIEKMKRSSLEASRHDQVSKKRRRGNVDNEVLLNWLTEQLRNHKDITITDTASVFRGGKALCAIIHHYRPDLLDYSAIKDNGPDRCNQMAMDILEKDLGIPPFMTGEEITNSEDSLALATYLTQVYDTFRGEIPHIKHPKLRKKSPSKIPRILPKNPLPPELLRKLNMAERKISQTTIVSTNVKTITPNTEKRRKKKDSIDDLVMIEKERKSDKEKLKLKKRKVQSKPLTSLSEKTFFSDAIGGLKKVKNDAGLNKIEFFDVTYLEDCDATRKKRVKSRDRAKKGGGNDSEVKKVGKTIIRTSIVENPAGSSLNSPRLPSCSRLQRMRFPQFRGRTRHKNGKKVLPSTEQPCPILTPADAQIIKTLGINLTDVSNSNKKCHRRSQNRKNLHRSQNYRQKFPFERGDSIILKQEKFSSNRKMDVDDMDQTFNRVSSWISQHDFKAVGEEVRKDPEGETVVTYDIASDITSITRAMAKKKGEYDDIRVEERTDVIRCESPISSSEENFVELVKNLKEGKGLNLKDGKSPVKPVTKFSQYLPFAGGNMKAMSAPPTTFSVIVEGEESELPESNKRSEFSFKSIKTTHQPSIPTIQPSRPSSRHKRHAEPVQKPCSIDRKQRKRRTLEKIGPSVIYSRWFLPLAETLIVGLFLLFFDTYINPEEYVERSSSYMDYFWEKLS